jgi:hypothetical protein
MNPIHDPAKPVPKHPLTVPGLYDAAVQAALVAYVTNVQLGPVVCERRMKSAARVVFRKAGSGREETKMMSQCIACDIMYQAQNGTLFRGCNEGSN